jgi:hypothetical protein
MLKTSTLEALRSLALAVHRDLSVSVDPGILRSRAYARDRKYLASATELELLQELPIVGKSFDRSLCLGQESNWRAADDVTLPPVPESRFSYFLDGARAGSAECVRAFRQIHLLYAKYECSTDADEAILAFVSRQNELPESLPRTPLLRCAS